MLISTSNFITSGKLPQGSPHWGTFNRSFVPQKITPVELVQQISQGHAYAPVFLKNKQPAMRNKANFHAAQHIGLDFDSGDTKEDLTSNPLIAEHACFIHTTPSHTESSPKLRAVFVLEKPIRDREKYELAQKAIHYLFPTVDPTGAECSRFFYGARECDIVYLDNELDFDTLNELFVQPYKAYLETTQVEGKIIIPPDNPCENNLWAVINSSLRAVETAEDGTKHHELIKSAYTLGGLAGAGYNLEGKQLQDLLRNAIQKNPNNVQDMDAAFRTINDGLKAGYASPFYLTRQPDKWDRLLPNLSEANRAAVIAGVREELIREAEDLMDIWPYSKDIISALKMGATKTIDPETGEILITKTIDLGGNIEYRHEIDVWYADDTEANTLVCLPSAGQTLLIPDNEDAIALANSNMIIQEGQICQIVGLPHITVSKTSLEQIVDPVLLLGETDELPHIGLHELGSNLRISRLPFELSEIQEFGVHDDILAKFVAQAEHQIQ